MIPAVPTERPAGEPVALGFAFDMGARVEVRGPASTAVTLLRRPA